MRRQRSLRSRDSSKESSRSALSHSSITNVSSRAYRWSLIAYSVSRHHPYPRTTPGAGGSCCGRTIQNACGHVAPSSRGTAITSCVLHPENTRRGNRSAAASRPKPQETALTSFILRSRLTHGIDLTQSRPRGGTLKFDRLEQDMLSSMPLCFNLFGHLRLHRSTAADVFQRLLDLNIEEIEEIEVEVAPQKPASYLNDHTAFDGAPGGMVAGSPRGRGQ